MKRCERCGIDTTNNHWCDDCAEVEGRRRGAGEPLSAAERSEVYAGILEYSAMGIPQREIAENYGVARSLVSYVVGKARVAA